MVEENKEAEQQDNTLDSVSSSDVEIQEAADKDGAA